MKTIKIAKAEPFSERPIQPVTIEIDDVLDLPADHASLDQAAEFYDAQAGQIADALFDSLPQGTFDRLTIKIMQKKISLYAGLTDS